jgi:sortase A
MADKPRAQTDGVPGVGHSLWLGRVQWLFAAIGIVLLVWCAFVAANAARFQRDESSTLERAVNGNKTVTTNAPISHPRQAKDQLIGRLEIPRLHLSVMVAEGDDDNTLRKAVGHLPETPLPWEFGNSAVAGHRDTFFRPLKDVRVNDRVRVLTPRGNFQYSVSRITIVEPNDVSVLAATDHSLLTLVTCYPFYYVGQAPKRFIVQASHVPG